VQMQTEVNEFMVYVKQELSRGLDDWEQRLGTALVKTPPGDLVRTTSTESSASPLHTSSQNPPDGDD